MSYTPQYVTTPQGINAELSKIAVAVSRCVQRYAESPNELQTDLDLNGNRVLNLPAATDPTDPMRRTDTIQYLDTVYLQKLITEYGLGTSGAGSGTGGSGGTTNHALLTNRDLADQHPISAITNLTTTLASKQNTLVSGTTIKTLNGESLLGAGNITISTGGGGTTDHTALTNRTLADQHPVSAITGLQAALDGKAATTHMHAIADVTGLQAALDSKQIIVSATAPVDTTKLWLDIT